MVPGDRTFYIVAADPLARGGLAAVLSNLSGWVLVDYGDADAAQIYLADSSLRKSKHAFPDALLWDEGWHPRADISDLQAILTEHPDLPLVVLAAPDELAVRIWQMGVAGLLTRSATPEHILTALNAVANHLRVHDPHVLPVDEAGASRSSMAADIPIDALTPRELEVLTLVAEGLSNKQIARRLAISEHTVKFHMNSLLAKLSARSRTEAVVNAGRAGIIQV